MSEKFNMTVIHEKNSLGIWQHGLLNRQLHNDWEVKFEDSDTMIDVLVRIILKDKHDA